MCYDYYAFLSRQNDPNYNARAPGFIDVCTEGSCRKKPPGRKTPDPKIAATNNYIRKIRNLTDPQISFGFDPDFARIPCSFWFGMAIHFILETPWYSKDDCPLHVLDNPVRKDRIFGKPFMSASSWKGSLRWSCRMQESGVGGNNGKDDDWIHHLFGNEKEAETIFQSGALCFYPTWFDKIDFEVINPHARATRSGKQPIYYEVVPPDAEGLLYLLYAPSPGEIDFRVSDAMKKLVNAIETLLEAYGISAKRTVGWGTARIDKWKGCPGNGQSFETASAEEFTIKAQEIFG